MYHFVWSLDYRVNYYVGCFLKNKNKNTIAILKLFHGI